MRAQAPEHSELLRAKVEPSLTNPRSVTEGIEQQLEGLIVSGDCRSTSENSSKRSTLTGLNGPIDACRRPSGFQFVFERRL